MQALQALRDQSVLHYPYVSDLAMRILLHLPDRFGRCTRMRFFQGVECDRTFRIFDGPALGV